MEYDLGVFVGAGFTGQDNLNDPDARVAGKFAITRGFLLSTTSITQQSPTRTSFATEIFHINTDICVETDFPAPNCSSRENVLLAGGFEQFTFSGDALDIFCEEHLFRNSFFAELLNTDGTTVDDDYSLRFLSESVALPDPRSTRSATFTISYHTDATPVPLPASATLLTLGVGALAAAAHGRRRRARTT
jgi:hypothetical protein